MARKNIMERLDEVAKSTEIQGQVVELLNIPEKDLVDYPKNNEDISFTEDLEVSMENNGFTDPIEVTDFEMAKGKYMILSGHRRRSAARKKGYTVLPCIIRHFQDSKEMEDYILMSNAQRNTESDPLLYCKRYKLHEDFLVKSNFKGSIREEIAKRLGISVQQIDRYRQMNKVIMPVWDLVRSGQVGMSSVVFLSSYSLEDQNKMYDMFTKDIKNGVRLSRERCAFLKQSFESSVSNEEPKQKPEQADLVKPEPTTPIEKPVIEVKEEKPEPKAPVEKPVVEVKEEKPEPKAPVEKPVVEVKEEKPEPKATINSKADAFFYHVEKVDEYLTGKYNIESKETAAKVLKNLEIIVLDALEEIKRISNENQLSGSGNYTLKSISKHLESCLKK